MGTLVACDIVFMEKIIEPVSFKKEIKKFLSDKTEAYKIPSLINFVDSIMFSDSGKINRS